MAMLQNFSALFIESAPWLVLGFLVAGCIKVFLPMSWLRKQLGQEGFASVVKAALILKL